MSPFARIRQALSLAQPAPRWMEREDFLRMSRQLREQKGRPVARSRVAARIAIRMTGSAYPPSGSWADPLALPGDGGQKGEQMPRWELTSSRWPS